VKGGDCLPSEEALRAEGWAAGQLAQAQSNYDGSMLHSDEQNAAFSALQSAQVMRNIATQRVESERFRELNQSLVQRQL